jgi:undecaprenyl-diphosphatase
MHFFSEATNHLWVKVVLGLIVIAMAVRGPRSRAAALQALIAVGIGNEITELFKHLLPMKRPYQELQDVVLHNVGTGAHKVADLASAMGTSAHDAANMGTASAHSANMAAVAFVFCYRLKWWGTPWIAIALLTGYSRIYLGAHYPYQVLFGWTCGCFAAFVVTKTWDLVSNRNASESRTIEAEMTTETL